MADDPRPRPRAESERAPAPATPGSESERPPAVALAAWAALGGVAVCCLLVSLAALVAGARRGDAFVGRCGLVGCVFSAALVRAVWNLYVTTERGA